MRLRLLARPATAQLNYYYYYASRAQRTTRPLLRGAHRQSCCVCTCPWGSGRALALRAPNRGDLYEGFGWIWNRAPPMKASPVERKKKRNCSSVSIEIRRRFRRRIKMRIALSSAGRAVRDELTESGQMHRRPTYSWRHRLYSFVARVSYTTQWYRTRVHSIYQCAPANRSPAPKFWRIGDVYVWSSETAIVSDVGKANRMIPRDLRFE